MTDPKDLQHYLDEKMGAKSKKEEQAQRRVRPNRRTNPRI